MKFRWKQFSCFVLAVALLVSAFSQIPVKAGSTVSCKSLCNTALKATGNSSKLKYMSSSSSDFGALSYSDRKKVKSIQYVFDTKEVYSLCVMEASNTSDAKALASVLKNYKKRNCKSDYLSDYSSTEKKVFKNAVYGRKGNYVWYISMSSDKSKNKKGQTALKKKL
ncbi:MAG: hypothetical protein PUC39_05510 [Lachnospiraceae bacterium]|nr:hypothetical protein [Lachnospiraceae bacterium]